MEFVHLENFHLNGFYLAVNTLSTDKTQNIFI